MTLFRSPYWRLNIRWSLVSYLERPFLGILSGYSNVIFLPFDPAKNAIPRWYTGRRWHILMAVMRGNRVGGNWRMKWDELKKFAWYTHKLMHRKRVTCELHDSYFRLMTIKHSISKIEWAIKWALNYYITQSRRQLSSTGSSSRVGDEEGPDVVGKATPGRGGPREPR